MAIINSFTRQQMTFAQCANQANQTRISLKSDVVSHWGQWIVFVLYNYK